ncbi:unnamed protein product [Prorocentrum cordatum]|uniref:Uncharacterized protein n=1 Tax=Prorocentrum cordatum TaxID=2364126 RepID=A0ABN9UQR7_9DINO|nr:unnamed protein product [Polarella glacialis]
MSESLCDVVVEPVQRVLRRVAFSHVLREAVAEVLSHSDVDQGNVVQPRPPGLALVSKDILCLQWSKTSCEDRAASLRLATSTTLCSRCRGQNRKSICPKFRGSSG